MRGEKKPPQAKGGPSGSVGSSCGVRVPVINAMSWKLCAHTTRVRSSTVKICHIECVTPSPIDRCPRSPAPSESIWLKYLHPPKTSPAFNGPDILTILNYGANL
uniref:Uncharacterized protein n=1 Tax=Anopheles culicifacies TaxID=139723 RepID=A0A182LZL8_9DIPT